MIKITYVLVRQFRDVFYLRELRRAPFEEQVTYGEILSTTILECKLRAEGYDTLWLDSRARGRTEGHLKLVEEAFRDAEYVPSGWISGAGTY